ncbi:histidinol-phosphatase HisJ family protein [Sporosarcina thermotolerans]|uniref:Histidinol-phosphatase n=1 Tax=Sporosarcina thermotolerans TaxID=633404 RepID=A0AAW9A7W8_9BACL|nr:histidinol-phosphatase HisJ family protein [Sporosarcina thermotolerans]MDW0117080.1 histidinol-phosphatase HisJ family protein [Sporosarcina thermotolerans]WHT47825.1 histidinol-phosphatase HisJ family protein [Sporosarcina thermotolerans]
MFDYHMHSSFSKDCTVEMEDMVKGAIAKGLTEICFTEHIDYDFPDDAIEFDFDKQKYTERIEELRQLYDGQIIIRKGVEIGVQPHILQRYDEMLNAESFDFIICSMHTVERKGLHYGEIFKGKTAEEASISYYNELLHCVKNFDNYSVLGHIDLIKRYAPEIVQNDFHAILTEIFNHIIPAGKGIELNTSGVRYGLSNGLPSDDILKLYKQCGGEIITLGSDAHKPEHIAFQFKESLELVKSIGFSYITSFNNQEPVFHPIDKLL